MRLELNPEEKKIFELARPYLQVMSNTLHTEEVVYFCLKLLKTVGGDRHICIPACILHDTGWSKIPEKIARKIRFPDGDPEFIKIHEEISALIAEFILSGVNYPRTWINEIVAMIIGHDSRKEAISLNDKILKDTDKLSRFSKDFSNVWPRWGDGSFSENLHEKLADGLKKWFFLPDARRLARIELDDRRREDQIERMPSMG